MCIQDYQMAQRTTLVRKTFVCDGLGFGILPDVSRAYMFWVSPPAGGILELYLVPSPGVVIDLPGDTRFAKNTGQCRYYSPVSLGALARGPIYAIDSPGQTLTVFMLEMDIETYTKTLQLTE